MHHVPPNMAEISLHKRQRIRLYILNYVIVLFLSNISCLQLCQMFYRGQLCELYFQILDHKQSRRPPQKKFFIRFTPLALYTNSLIDTDRLNSAAKSGSLRLVFCHRLPLQSLHGITTHFTCKLHPRCFDNLRKCNFRQLFRPFAWLKNRDFSAFYVSIN